MSKVQNLVLTGLVFFCSAAKSEMVSSDLIGNDPERVKICAERAKAKPVPFEIDYKYVERSRARNPEATFIASGSSGQLVECILRKSTGKFEPHSYSPEQWYWRLPRPKQFEPSIKTQNGKNIVSRMCSEITEARLPAENFEHSVINLVVEIPGTGPKYLSGAVIAGKKAEPYDVAVEGTAFYKATGFDLKAIKFTCLFTPMLEIKAFQSK